MSVSRPILAAGLAPLPDKFRYAWFVPSAFARLGMLLMILARAAPAQEAIRPVESVFEAQVELHRRGFSCGSIDGVAGPQTAAALRAFQRQTALTETGILDPDTRTALELTAPALTTHLVSEDELATLQRVPPTWLEKSQAIALTHANALELIAERYRASPRLVRRLNPDVNWDAVTPGTPVAVPAVASITFPRKAALLTIRLEARTLEAVDTEGRLLAHFPVSIARKVEKRPRGQLRITVVIPDPNYTFNPEMYPETPEAKESLTRKLIVPPGPNNPVGLAWVGLDLPGYGIHGTPEPEKVGRTESHGCFRLANWDAVALVGLVAVGIPVIVEP